MGEHDGHRDRLRKRFLEQGMDVLQDDQVLELLLFYALPRRDTNDLARKLLKHFGSIAAVLEAPLQELKTVGGIGESAAVLLHLITPLARRYLLSRVSPGVVLTSTQACGEYLLPYFFGATEELVYLLCLDGRCRVLACRLCSGAASTPPPSPCARQPRSPSPATPPPWCWRTTTPAALPSLPGRPGDHPHGALHPAAPGYLPGRPHHRGRQRFRLHGRERLPPHPVIFFH